MRELPTDGDAATLLRDALKLLGSAACVTSSSIRASTASRGRRRGRAAAAACSPTSSASASSRSTSASCSRRPAVAGRPSTTCCSPGRPGSARRRWPGSSPPRWACTLHITSGPALERAGDLAAILTKLEERDVLFVDEIHRLLTGRRGDPLPGDGGLPARHRRRQGPGGVEHPADAAAVHARRRHDAHRHDHRAAARPLRARRPPRLLRRRPSWRRSSAAPRASSTCRIDEAGAWEIARRSRGTPRIANRLLRRVRDFAEVRGDGTVDAATARTGLRVFGVDDLGLDKVDRAVLGALCQQFRRRAGRVVHAGDRRRRAARDGRGRVRAVPHPAGPDRPHARGPGGDARGLRPPRPGRADPGRRRARPACSTDGPRIRVSRAPSVSAGKPRTKHSMQRNTRMEERP